MAKGIRDSDDRGGFGGRERREFGEGREFGERGERFERGGFFGFLRSLDFLHLFFPPEPFFLGGGFPGRGRRELEELELLEAERFRRPFFPPFFGFPRLGPFFGGEPDFDDFRFRRFGGFGDFDRDDFRFRRFPFFGGFRGFGDFDRDDFRFGGFHGGRGGDFGGMHRGMHPGGGEGGHMGGGMHPGGAHAFAAQRGTLRMPGDRGEGHNRMTFGGGNREVGGRRGGQSRREMHGRHGFEGEGRGRFEGEHRGFRGGGEFGEGSRFDRFEDRFERRGFRGFGDFDRDDFRFRGIFGERGERGEQFEQLLQLCLSNPQFAQFPQCQQIFLQLQGLGGFRGEFGERGEGRFGERGEGREGREREFGMRRAFASSAANPVRQTPMPAMKTTMMPAMMPMPIKPAAMPMAMMPAHMAMMTTPAHTMAASPIGAGSLHPAGPIGHAMGGVPMTGMTGGLESPTLHPGDMGGRMRMMPPGMRPPGDMDRDRGGRMENRHPGDMDDDRGRHFRDVDDDEFRRFHERGDFDDFGRHGRFDFDDFGRRRFFIDDDDFFGFGFVEPDLAILEEKCLLDPVFAETHLTLCLPIIEAQQGGFRSVAGSPVFAFAAATGEHLGGAVGPMASQGGFHPADPGQGGVGHVGMGGAIQQNFPGRDPRFLGPPEMRPGGDRDDGRGRPDIDIVRFHPERFRVFGDRLFDFELGDFLPFSYIEYQLVLQQNPLLLCAYFPELCYPRPSPFLVGQPLLGQFDDDRLRRRPIQGPQKSAMIPGMAPLPMVAPKVSTSTLVPAQPAAPQFMNATATTASGAVLPLIPSAPDISGQDPAMLMQTAFPAIAGDSGYQYANTDAFAYIPDDRRGNILGQPGQMAGRHNISIANYF